MLEVVSCVVDVAVNGVQYVLYIFRLDLMIFFCEFLILDGSFDDLDVSTSAAGWVFVNFAHS